MFNYLHWCEVVLHLVGYALLLRLAFDKKHQKYLYAYVCLVIAAFAGLTMMFGK